jgi:hypothetical protein
MKCLIKKIKNNQALMEQNPQFCGLLFAYEFTFHTFLLFS